MHCGLAATLPSCRCRRCRCCNASWSMSPRHPSLPLVMLLPLLVVVLRCCAPLFVGCRFLPLPPPTPLPSYTPPPLIAHLRSLLYRRIIALRCPTPQALAHGTMAPSHPSHHDPPASFWLVVASAVLASIPLSRQASYFWLVGACLAPHPPSLASSLHLSTLVTPLLFG